MAMVALVVIHVMRLSITWALCVVLQARERGWMAYGFVQVSRVGNVFFKLLFKCMAFMLVLVHKFGCIALRNTGSTVSIAEIGVDARQSLPSIGGNDSGSGSCCCVFSALELYYFFYNALNINNKNIFMHSGTVFAFILWCIAADREK
jgi:hypothetical protein